MIQQAHSSNGTSHHFALPGAVGLQLSGAAPADLQMVGRELGLAPVAAPVAGDLVLRFADRVGGPDERLIGHDDVAFTEDTFIVTRSKHHARLQIPFDRLGTPCELVFQRGGTKLPLLLPIVNLTLTARGILPLHASAFRYEGRSAVVTGWARGGKTTSLLGFMARGAQFISDDWTYIDLERRHMHGLAKPLEVADRQLAELPAFRQRVTLGQRRRMQAARMAEQLVERLAASRWGRKIVPANVAHQLLPALRRRRSVEVAPGLLFDAPAFSEASLQCPLGPIFFTISRASSEILVEPAKADELAERMALMLEQEYAALGEAYRKFRFAFPGRQSELLEQLGRRLREQLAALLANTPAYLVYHPYPVRAEAMFEALRRWL